MEDFSQYTQEFPITSLEGTGMFGTMSHPSERPPRPASSPNRAALHGGTGPPLIASFRVGMWESEEGSRVGRK